LARVYEVGLITELGKQDVTLAKCSTLEVAGCISDALVSL
jgi:hypothetical protein